MLSQFLDGIPSWFSSQEIQGPLSNPLCHWIRKQRCQALQLCSGPLSPPSLPFLFLFLFGLVWFLERWILIYLFFGFLVQRGHQNSLEMMPVFFLLMVLGGIRHPCVCAALGSLFLVTRYFYFTGYATGDPKNRLNIGFVPFLSLPLYDCLPYILSCSRNQIRQNMILINFILFITYVEAYKCANHIDIWHIGFALSFEFHQLQSVYAWLAHIIMWILCHICVGLTREWLVWAPMCYV